MAKQRGPDGRPIDVPTHKVRITPAIGGDPSGGDIPTDPPVGHRGAGSLFADEPPTRPAGYPDVASSNTGTEESKTVISPGVRRPVEASVKPSDAMLDPVAGWLVIVAGPGKGNFVKVGHGQNSMGRSENERICLDFGDMEISRNNHAILTYDPRGRKFYFQQGTGSNLVYLNDEPVLSPTAVEDRAELLIGNTRLRFVSFCGPGFSWQDEPES